MPTGPLTVAQRLNRRLHYGVIALLFAVIFLSGFRPMLDHPDLGWHVAQGRWMVEHGAFYRADVFNYPNLGRGVIDEYPLFQVVIYFSTQLGWWGPCLLAALSYGLLLAILIGAAWSFELIASATFSAAVGFWLLYLQVAFPLRPHVATFLGVVIFGVFVLRHREASAWTRFWPLALVQVLWTNSHSGFVLGPAMVALFGLEMISRRWVRSRLFPWTAVRTWSLALVLILLACFVNPHGVMRFGPPFYQQNLEEIRAYVGEMQPLVPEAEVTYNHLTLFALGVLGFSVFLRRGAVSFSFLFIGAIFYFEAISAKKWWPLFGLLLPLLVLSTGAFAHTAITRRRSLAWMGALGHGLILIPLAIAVFSLVDARSSSSLASIWRQFHAGRTEQPVLAVAWMKQHGVTGRLFHRCEEGGWLQQEGFDQTFSDTGFGKFDQAFIREIGLVSDRPGMLAIYLPAYRPDFIVCANFPFRWPAYLKQMGWRIIFYSPNSTVWARQNIRNDLHGWSDFQVQNSYTEDIRKNGLPQDMLFYVRQVLALHSMGLTDFARAQLTSLPAEMHRKGWYWEAARRMCFDFPKAPVLERDQFEREAETLGDQTVEFRAYAANDAGNKAKARALLEGISQPSEPEAVLLLQLEKKGNQQAALVLAQRNLFSLTDGERWYELAQIDTKIGDARAAHDWEMALRYSPDIANLISDANSYAEQKSDAAVLQAAEGSTTPYGVP